MKIDFYIMEKANHQQALLMACQLIETAYQENQNVHVQASSREEAERFDELLWTFRDDSFVPHEIISTTHDFSAPIRIGYSAQISQPVNQPAEVLINLSREIPSFYTQFEQIIEIVFSDPTVQQLARERYRQYRDQGYEITTHKIN